MERGEALHPQVRAELRAWCRLALHHAEVADACKMAHSTLERAMAGGKVSAESRENIRKALYAWNHKER